MESPLKFHGLIEFEGDDIPGLGHETPEERLSVVSPFYGELLIGFDR